MEDKCLIIADDLTGGADTGAQFAKNGLRTFLINLGEKEFVDFSNYRDQDVLVINTDSRALDPEKAFLLVSNLLSRYDPDLFPLIYKKIDSTLRGNIGYEIDALIEKTNSSICCLSPSYPEQQRTVRDGILMVGGKRLALSGIFRDDTSTAQESHICKILKKQSRNPIGWVGLKEVSSGGLEFQKRVDEERRRGNRILIFDAVSRGDLANIAGLAFRMKRRPLLVGSAGLAKEVARKLSLSKSKILSPLKDGARSFKQILIVSGSASPVTHRQTDHLRGKIPEFILPLSWVTEDDSTSESGRKEFSKLISNALSKGQALLKAPPEFIPKNLTGLPIHLKITKELASLTRAALEKSSPVPRDVALILTGGETAMSVIRLLQAEGISIEGELWEGIMKGYLVGGKWNGLTVITKAGAFGEQETLKKIVEILEGGRNPRGGSRSGHHG